MKIQVGKTLYTIAKDAFIVGSDASQCDIVIDDPHVLPLHLEATLRRRGNASELVLALTGSIRFDGSTYTSKSAAPVVRETTFGEAVVKLGVSRFRVLELHQPTGWVSRLLGQPGVTKSIAPRRQLPITKMNPPPPFVAVPPAIPETEMEATLLAAMFRDPTDLASRMVYADWLEQHDEGLAARVVRGDAFYEINNFAWRAMVSQGEITGCPRPTTCPATWDRCQLVEGDVAARTCAACKKTVRYVSATGPVTSMLNVLDE